MYFEQPSTMKKENINIYQQLGHVIAIYIVLLKFKIYFHTYKDPNMNSDCFKVGNKATS